MKWLSADDRPPSRARLIAPFAIGAVILAAYTGYWMLAAGQVRAYAEDWIAEQEAAGYAISHEGLSVGGYPFRFQLAAEAPVFTAPAEDGGWTARFDRIAGNALPYNFNHWIVSFGGPAELALPGEAGEAGEARYLMGARAARLSVSGRSGLDRRIGAELEEFSVQSLSGPEPAIERIASLALSGEADERDVMRLRLEARGVRTNGAEADLVAALGPTVALTRLDMAFTEWSTLAAEADLAAWTLAEGRLVINAAQIVWGAAELSGDGALALDGALRPRGRLSVVLADLDSLVDAMVAGGVVSTEEGEAIRVAALMAPRREGGVALPLRVQDGGLFLGPARSTDL